PHDPGSIFAHCSVRDGSINNMGGQGIHLFGKQHEVKNVTVQACAHGFDGGEEGRIVDCTASGCSDLGFNVGNGGIVSRCISVYCVTGFYGGTDFSDCNASLCGVGFSTLGCSLRHCTAENCSGTGFASFGSNTYDHCSANNNQSLGFDAGNDSTLR